MHTGEQLTIRSADESPRTAARATRVETMHMETHVQLDFLGELRRTHTCGELRASDAGKRALLDGLGAPPPRSWRRDLHPPARPRGRHARSSFTPTKAPRSTSAPKMLGSEYVIAVEGKVAKRTPGDHQSQPGHRRSGGGGREALDPERIAHAAVPHGRNRGRHGRRAAEVPLRRSAPPAHAAQHHAALEDRASRSASFCTSRASWKSKRRS